MQRYDKRLEPVENIVIEWLRRSWVADSKNGAVTELELIWKLFGSNSEIYFGEEKTYQRRFSKDSVEFYQIF